LTFVWTNTGVESRPAGCSRGSIGPVGAVMPFSRLVIAQNAATIRIGNGGVLSDLTPPIRCRTPVGIKRKAERRGKRAPGQSLP